MDSCFACVAPPDVAVSVIQTVIVTSYDILLFTAYEVLWNLVCAPIGDVQPVLPALPAATAATAATAAATASDALLDTIRSMPDEDLSSFIAERRDKMNIRAALKRAVDKSSYD